MSGRPAPDLRRLPALLGHTLGVDLLPIRKVQVEGHEAERVQTIPHVQEPLDIPGAVTPGASPAPVAGLPLSR